MFKILLRILLICGIPLIGYIAHYAWVSFPIISGFGAKELCSCIFVGGQKEAEVKTAELAEFPFTIGSYSVNNKDSSVTGTIAGVASRKAIYRRGLGCTLINDFDESTIRAQQWELTELPGNRDSIAWPDGDLIADTIPAGINIDQLRTAVNKAFEEPYPGKKQRTRAVVVVYNGQLVAEQYAPGFDKNSKLEGWSMAKSITAALVGILVKQGKLSVIQPAPVPEWQHPHESKRNITIKQLLQQTSGLEFREDYTKASEVTRMLFNQGDMAYFAGRMKLHVDTGTVFNYSGGNSNILSGIIRRTVGEKEYACFPARELFYKIGMLNTILEPDASGTFVGSSYIFAPARDYARFGLLYCNDGKWKGEQILPDEWVKETVTPPACNSSGNYGYQFWLNGIDHKNQGKRIFPDVPADMFYADGFAYQEIYILPSKKLVVVRLGLTLDRSFDENGFLKMVLASLR